MLKKIIINIALVALVVAVLDFAIGKALRHYYFKETSGHHFRTTYSIDSTKADILIFGSSRANHHYVPEIFEDSLKMSFYNTGRDGNSILYTLAVFNAITKRYSPEIIILDLRVSELYYDADTYARLSCLLPYYNNHPEIHNVIELRGPYEKYKLISSIYPFNSTILAVIIGNMEINKSRNTDTDGYVPLYGQMDKNTKPGTSGTNTPVDSISVEALRYISEMCTKNHIRLLIVHSPQYTIFKLKGTVDPLEQLTKENNITYLNYANDSLYLKNPGLFQDPSHLNDKGARIFSAQLAGLIKSYNLIAADSVHAQPLN